MKNFFKITLFSLIVGIFISTSFLFVGSVQALGVVSTPQTYVIQLRNDDISVLQPFVLPGPGSLSEKFTVSKNPKFDNIFTFTSAQSLTALKNQLAGKFTYLEIDKTLTTEAVEVTSVSAHPNDPGYTTNEANIDRQWGLIKAKFPEAWALTKGSRDTIVAVVDTGLDSTHEDFRDADIVMGFNVLTGKNIAVNQNSDDNGHGTLVTGVIGAATNNRVGIAGAAWNVSIMPIKGLSSRGSGTSSQISESIVWAADNGAHIINLSVGGIGFSHDTTLANAITHAYDKNVVIIAAVGNDVAITGGNLDIEPVFPICDDNGKNMITGVTATDVNDLKPDFANYGKACVDVSAPGKRILSTINRDPATNAFSPDSYAYASGTSLAAPYVSAQAALLKSLYPFATNRQIRDRIISTADPIDALNLSQCAGGSCAGFLGSGRINVEKSLESQIVRFQDGDVVQVQETGQLFYINGGKRQLITPFVKNQRFAGVTPVVVSLSDLDGFSEGAYAEPLDGTLVKAVGDTTIYYMSKGLRLPVTYQVFMLREFSFSNVYEFSNTEISSWLLGSFLTPLEGSLVRTVSDATVYWSVDGVLHPINYNFWVQRGLNIFPTVIVPDNDLAKYPKGEAYLL